MTELSDCVSRNRSYFVSPFESDMETQVFLHHTTICESDILILFLYY